MEYKNSYVDLSGQSDQQMKCVKSMLLKMCRIKQNLIKDRTMKTKPNASETEQHAVFSYTTKCKKHICEIAVLNLDSQTFHRFHFQQNISKR